MIVSGLFIWSLMTLVSGFATSIAVLIGARVVVGVSQAMLSPAVHSYMADTFSAKHRATLFSIYASGIFLGIGLSYLAGGTRSEEHTSELQSRGHLVCRLLLEKKNHNNVDS